MTPQEAKDQSRGFSTDMSGKAVARRVAIVSELRALALWLEKGKKLGPVEPQRDVKDSKDTKEE